MNVHGCDNEVLLHCWCCCCFFFGDFHLIILHICSALLWGRSFFSYTLYWIKKIRRTYRFIFCGCDFFVFCFVLVLLDDVELLVKFGLLRCLKYQKHKPTQHNTAKTKTKQSHQPAKQPEMLNFKRWWNSLMNNGMFSIRVDNPNSNHCQPIAMEHGLAGRLANKM